MLILSRTRSMLLTAASLALLGGCQHGPTVEESVATLAGSVHGGQQPVAGATVQLYAANPTVNAGPATLIVSAVTDASGGFTLPRPYSCPAMNSSTYIVATGGNPGLGPNGTNPALALMAALGSCDTLSASTSIQINELTTVAAVGQLYPYMTSYSQVGATSQAALTSAFNNVRQYVDYASGGIPGPTLPSGFYASQITITSLADILAGCVNSNGTGSGCTGFFSLYHSPVPTDTIRASISLFQNPTSQIPALLNLIPSAAPFQPTLSAAPATLALSLTPIPAAPTIAPAAGTFTAPQTVTLTPAVAGTAIYYTTNGSAPTESSTLYTGPFTLSANATVQAIASASQGNDSAPASAAYTFNLTSVTPTPSYGSGTYNSPLSVTLTGALPGASIYYTVDGTTPVPFTAAPHSAAKSHPLASGSSKLYTGPIAVQQSETITYLSSAPGYANSPTQSVTYTILLPAPTASPTSVTNSNFYADQVTVTLSDYSSGTQIYYTTDGSTPTTSSTLYSYPFTLRSSTTVKAIQNVGPTSSTVATFSYVVKPTTITFTPTPGTYNGGTTVTIATNAGVGNIAANAGQSGVGILQNFTAGAYLFYSVNGGIPTLYQGPFAVSISATITAGITDSGDHAAEQDYYLTATGAYTITNPIVATPVFSNTGGTFGTFQTVTLTDSTAGASLYYTTNGTTPTAASTLYTGPITVSTSESLQAIGIESGYVSSAVATSTFNIINVITTILSGHSTAGLAVNSSGNLIIVDDGTSNGYYDSTIVQLTPAGNLTILAGNGNVGFSGDGGLATSAMLTRPSLIAISPSNGTIYVNDGANSEIRDISGNYIYKYSTWTFASSLAASNNNLYEAASCALYLGNGTNYPLYVSNSNVNCGYSGDGGLMSAANFSAINGVAATPAGQVYLSDTGNNRIRTFLQNTNIVTTYAGTGIAGFSGDNGQARSAQISAPKAIAVDPSGNVYFYDSANARIRSISTAGVIITVAGNGTVGYTGDGGSALLAAIHPEYLAVDSSGNIYFSNFNDQAIRKITIAH